MKLEELLDMTLREVLENFCAVRNLECCFFYRIFKVEDVEKVLKEFNVEKDYPEAFNVESLIDDELIVSADDEVRDYDTLLRIMDNLGISKKGEKSLWE